MLKEDDVFKFMQLMEEYRVTKPLSEFSNKELISFFREELPNYNDIWNEIEKRLILNGSNTDNIEEAEIIDDFEDNMGAMG